MNPAGHCSVCGLTVPATPAAAPHEGMVRLIEHDHPKPQFGRCIGSCYLAPPMEGNVQMHLYGEVGEAA